MASSKSSRPSARRSRSIYSVSLSSSSRRDPHHHHRSLIGEPIVSREDSWRVGSWPLVEVVVPVVPREPVLSGGPRKPTVNRRKSAFGRLTSFLSPSLNSGVTADSPYSSVHRKPVSAPDAVSPPNQTHQHHHQHQYQHQQPYPPHALPNYPPHGFQAAPADLPPGLGIYSAAQPPPAAHLAGPERAYQPPPQAHENQRGRNGHRVPSVIQKTQKLPQAPPPLPPRDNQGPAMPEFQETPASPPTLKKTKERKRSNSFQHADLSPKNSHGGKLQPRRRGSPSPTPTRQRSVSAHPPSSKRLSRPPPDQPRVPSLPSTSRPQSSHDSDGAGSEKLKLRRSWLPGGRSRSNSQDLTQQPARDSAAWVLSPDNSADYNLSFLVNGEKVPELWNENGTVYVYLNPKGVDQGASFKVPGYTISSSSVLNQLIGAELASPVSARTQARSFGGRGQLSAEDATRRPSPSSSPPFSPSDGESRLFLPLAPGPNGTLDPRLQGRQDPERLVALRNLFAFLTGQPLVGTKAHCTLFAAFLQVARLLNEFGFSSPDGTTFGEAVHLSFGFYINQLGFADVRHSREKTVEALILGERMRSWDLYNEAFTHAVGKYSAIMALRSPLVDRLLLSTQRRLERAHLDLLNRQHNVNIRLEQFDFPAVFAGVASSTSNPDYKNIRFKNWRTAYGDMRSFVLKFYKHQFGNWPPKASSKKNPFTESGLNRQVLKALYSDLCSLYDLVVDRESITPRVVADQKPDDEEDSTVDPTVRALRQMLAEFDHSSPPVLPPIPFDVPKLPTMATVRETYHDMHRKDQARFDRGIQAHELQLILLKSHNMDAEAVRTPFLAAFKEFELKEARGKSAVELAEQRVGYWTFLYVVIQSLPMLVVDAPGLHFTEGVEYFLCEPPQGNLPWVEDAGEVRKMWYQTAGGTNVELSADVVMFSVEATYHRSHCWLAAKLWEAAAAAGPPGSVGSLAASGGASIPDAMSPLEAPHPAFELMDPVASPTGSSLSSDRRGRSPGRGYGARPSSIAIGLEPVSNPLLGAAGSRHSSLPALPAQPEARRVASAGNLAALQHRHHHRHHPSDGSEGGRRRQEPQPAGGAGGGSTFDDILQGMNNQKKETVKKRASFLPF